ncbi:NAD(P)H-binding protein [Actinocrispum sp. NPDC049592]|uniref:NAD(P)H-binding protein n=1 Tax=Actinocrispum sp. NPDC049592 TaxID=3154835 RepID=UPI003435ECC7
MTILVTGATGKVGGQVVRQLAERGLDVRALVRDPATARLPDGVSVVRGSLPTVDSSVFEGVDRLFLVWPFFGVDGLGDFLDALPARRVVYLSSSGGAQWAEAAEAVIRSRSLDWTFLRPTGFAGNTLEFASQVKEAGVIEAAFASLARPYIHEADIAAVGVRALLDDGYIGKSFELSGPALVSQTEVARTIGEVTGRPVRFRELTPAQGAEKLRSAGWAEELVTSASAAWAHMTEHPEPVTSTVEEVTGSPARTYRQWVIDHAGAFSPTATP